MGRRPIEVKRGDRLGNREVVRELPSNKEPGGGTRRMFLVRCTRCGALSRNNRTNLMRTDCKCVSRNVAPDGDHFRDKLAPLIADQTGTIYGGLGTFWQVCDGGDLFVKFKLPKETRTQ